MECIVEFDLLDAGYRDWWFSAFPVIFVVVGIGMVLRGESLFIRGIGALAFFIAAYFAFTSIQHTYGRHLSLKEAYTSGSYTVAEGRVENYRLTGSGGRERELFTVNGEYFEYADAELNGGYHQTNARGGAVSAGRYVIIWHVRGVIIRLESCNRAAGQA